METFFTKLLEWIWDVGERYLFFWIIMRSYEKGVVLRLGKFRREVKPGVSLKLPLFDEYLSCLCKPETLETRAISITTLDEQTATVTLIGCYEVEDGKKFLLDANDAATNIVHHLMSVSADFLSDYTFDELKQRKSYTPIKNKLNETIKYLGAKFTMIGYGTITKSRPIALINH